VTLIAQCNQPLLVARLRGEELLALLVERLLGELAQALLLNELLLQTLR